MVRRGPEFDSPRGLLAPVRFLTRTVIMRGRRTRLRARFGQVKSIALLQHEDVMILHVHLTTLATRERHRRPAVGSFLSTTVKNMSAWVFRIPNNISVFPVNSITVLFAVIVPRKV